VGTRILAVTLVLVACAAGTASATVTSDFSDSSKGLDGWVMWNQGGYTHSSHLKWVSDGLGGGYIEYDDSGYSGTDFFQAPAKFLGNWQASLATEVSFRYRPKTHADYAISAWLGGPGGSVYWDSGVIPTQNVWKTWTMPLTASAWHTTDATLQSVLSNVTSLKICGDLLNGSDLIDLDDVVRTDAPGLPAFALAGAVPVIGAVLRRRRR